MLSDSLALRPLELDVKESNNNVLSLMSSMDDEFDDIALVVEGTEGESEFKMPSGALVKQRHLLYQLGVYLSLAIKERGFGP